MSSPVRLRSRWLKRDASLLVFGIGGTLTGFVQLIPLIAPRAPQYFIQGLSLGVFALTVVLLGVAFFGGRWAQMRQIEKLRIRMIRRRRFLVRWERIYRESSMLTGYLLSTPEEHRDGLRKLNIARFRVTRMHRLWLRAFGSHFDEQWLIFQRARNEYYIEIDRKPLPIYETRGIVALNVFNVEIGRQYGIQQWLKVQQKSPEMLSALLNVSVSAIRLQEAHRADDALSIYLRTVDEDVRDDDGTNPTATFLKEVLDELASDEFLRKLSRLE